MARRIENPRILLVHALSLSHTQALSRTRTLTHTHALSLSHTRTLTHTHSLTHTLTHNTLKLDTPLEYKKLESQANIEVRESRVLAYVGG
jgi:hypothetical protein